MDVDTKPDKLLISSFSPSALVLLSAALGLVISAIAFLWTQSLNTTAFNTELSRRASLQTSIIQNSIDNRIEIINSIGSLLESSQSIGRKDFNRFLESTLSWNPGIEAFTWAPRVKNDDRASFEAAVQLTGIKGFRITELQEDGLFVTAKERPEYFPVLFLEPLTPNMVVLGFDSGSNPERMRTIEISRDGAAIITTKPISLVNKAGKKMGFLIFRPVYKTNMSTGSIEDRRANLLGFSLGVFQAENFIESVLSEESVAGLDMLLTDKGGDSGETMLYFHPSRSRKDADTKVLPPALGEKHLLYDQLNLPGRTWSVLYRPSPETLSQYTPWEWLALATGLLLTGIVSYYLFTTRRSLQVTHLHLAQIEESEQRFKRLYENAPLAYQSLDSNGVVINTNNAWSRCFGYDQNEARGTWFGEFIVDEYLDLFKTKFPRLKDTGEVHGIEFKMRCKDGAIKDISLDGRASYGLDGNFRQSHCLLSDITERKRTEQIIQEQAQNMSNLLNSTAEAIYGLDVQGNCTFANPTCVELLGYSNAKEIIGKNMHALVHHHHADGREYAVEDCPVVGAFKSGDKTHVDTEVFWRADGNSFNAEYWSYPIYTDSELTGAVVTFLDISEKIKTDERIRTLSQAVEQSPVTVVITDAHGNITYVNQAFTQISGYTPEEVIGKNPRILNSGNTPLKTYKELWETIKSGKQWHGEFQNRKKNGRSYFEEAWIAPVINEAGETTHYVAVKEDITTRKSQEETILHQAHFDSLTDLPNRLLSLDRLGQLIKEAKRNTESVAVLFLDLDDFKTVNDTLGHEAGDKLLIQCAQRLTDLLRSGDTIGRLGGDEFIVLLSGTKSGEHIQSVTENIISVFQQPFSIQNRDLVVSTSIGISLYPEDGSSSSELLRNADAAMYHAKKNGRNTYAFFTEQMNTQATQRLALEEQLHGALDRNELSVFYQPQIDLNTGAVVGAEALLRWQNPVIGSPPH